LTRQTFHEELTAYLQTEQDRIYRLAYSYMEDEQDALDVVQAAAVKALTASPMRQPRYLKTWMYRIVVNTAIDSLRARKRRVPLNDWTSADGEDHVREDASLDVREALRSLPTDLRAIVVLRYFHELELREVADVLSMNLSTVKTRLYRALKLLSIEMEDDHE
jgi:RNA polymerase sigma-70 factor, ECF subfamily